MSEQLHEPAERFHYYSLTFMDRPTPMTQRCGSVYLGWREQMVTKPRIDEAKVEAGVGPEAVLMACCYLGYMTREQMLGDVPPVCA